MLSELEEVTKRLYMFKCCFFTRWFWSGTFCSWLVCFDWSGCNNRAGGQWVHAQGSGLFHIWSSVLMSTSCILISDQTSWLDLFESSQWNILHLIKDFNQDARLHLDDTASHNSVYHVGCSFTSAKQTDLLTSHKSSWHGTGYSSDCTYAVDNPAPGWSPA